MSSTWPIVIIDQHAFRTWPHCAQLLFHVFVTYSLHDKHSIRKFTMPPKTNRVWQDLNAKMVAKKTTNRSGRGKGQKQSVRELVVQRLTAEPDNKQTFCPVQPREFVQFEADDLALDNLKITCAAHFGLPVSTCDSLVLNKSPSCTNISQIPHRKDKVM